MYTKDVLSLLEVVAPLLVSHTVLWLYCPLLLATSFLPLAFSAAAALQQLFFSVLPSSALPVVSKLAPASERDR